MHSKAATVAQYLASLPADRRAAVEAVRRVILANLDRDVEEGMQYGMIGYYVPHRVYPAGYHCDPRQPLPYLCLASQKNYLSLYLMTAYADGAEEGWFRKSWAQAGKKLDMGKCCIRFKKVEDLALDVLAAAIRRVPVRKHIEFYESAIGDRRSGAKKPAGGATSASTAARKATPKKLAAARTKPIKKSKTARRGAKSLGKKAARKGAGR